MSIVFIFGTIPPKRMSECSICKVKLPWNRATAGLYDAGNNQVFACISHFAEPSLLILGWADFLWAERTKYWLRRVEPNELTYGEPHSA